uniref:FecR protein domain-containing protein n=1 Tax=uncultured Desulfobacterium sp. TaxID=201089 RepID=E1YLN3_9BACT|nr:hypothetical protein N47_E45280 [uncultured Desulfobacterium sp.]
MKSLQVKDYFIKADGLPVGTIRKSSGHVVVVHGDTGKACYVMTGDAVYQQDVFYTLKDSRCRIRFKTEDIITMGENGKIVVEEVSEDNALKEKKSVISMLKGKAMFYVVRLFKYKSISASVKTPTAVMGVRGTKFGVEVKKAGEKVADLSDRSLIYLAENGSDNFETIIHGFDGVIDVTSNADGSTNNVGAGESLFVDNLGAGSVEPTDPNIANQFIQQTEGGGFIVSGISGSGAGDTGDVVENIITTVIADLSVVSTDNYSENLSQTLTGSAIDAASGPVNKIGYFTAMLTDSVSSAQFYNSTYTSTSLQNLDNPGAEAVAPGNYVMKVDASSGMTNAKLTNLETYFDTISGAYPVSFTELGHNTYMEWGYWTQPEPMNGTDYTYYVDNRGYYMVGDPTSATDMAVLQNLAGWYSYSGAAYGTSWTSTGGSNMTGSFDAKVSFMDGIVSNFNLSVSDPVNGHSASVTNAGGDFTTGAQFELNGPGQIDGQQQANFTSSGSLYGPAGQAIGGAWSINSVSAGGHATGIYSGTNQGPTTAP